MNSGAFIGNKIPHFLRHERYLNSMTWDNLTALKLGPQAQRTEQASDLRGLGIPEMEANRYEGKVNVSGAVSEWGGAASPIACSSP
jgi:hypothetical protein